MHDLLTGTTVQLAADTDPEVADFYVEREDEPATLLPSKIRRTVVAVVYLIMLFIIFAVVLGAIDPQRCARQGNCSDGMRAILEVVGLLWIVASLASIVAVWKGRMLGARRRRESNVERNWGQSGLS